MEIANNDSTLQASIDELTAAVGRPVVGFNDSALETAQRAIDAVVAAPGADSGCLASLLSLDDELAGVQREVHAQLEAGAVRVCRAVAAGRGLTGHFPCVVLAIPPIPVPNAVAPVQTAAEAALKAITALHAATGPLEAVRDEVKHLGVSDGARHAFSGSCRPCPRTSYLQVLPKSDAAEKR